MGLIAGAVLGAAATAAGAATLSLHATPGLWQIASTVKIGGMHAMAMSMSSTQMAQMPPEARARMQAAMAAMDGTHVNTMTSCVTEKDLARPFHPEGNEPGETCQETVVTATASDQEIDLVCSGKRSMQGKVHFEMPTPTTMHGHMEVTAVENGHPMTISTQLDGHWLGADCAAAKHG